MPIFSSTPARMTEPAVGASTWASGSQVWNGNIGTLIANPRKNASQTHSCSAIQSGQEGNFSEVVVVEWPQPGSFTLGFVANRDCSWAIPNGQHMIAVYVPTSPNPTSGYVVMVDATSVRKVDLSPNQALTWAISGGVVVPVRTGSGILRMPEQP